MVDKAKLIRPDISLIEVIQAELADVERIIIGISIKADKEHLKFVVRDQLLPYDLNLRLIAKLIAFIEHITSLCDKVMQEDLFACFSDMPETLCFISIGNMEWY